MKMRKQYPIAVWFFLVFFVSMWAVVYMKMWWSFIGGLVFLFSYYTYKIITDKGEIT
jgi:hypothetical protein